MTKVLSIYLIPSIDNQTKNPKWLCIIAFSAMIECYSIKITFTKYAHVKKLLQSHHITTGYWLYMSTFVYMYIHTSFNLLFYHKNTYNGHFVH